MKTKLADKAMISSLPKNRQSLFLAGGVGLFRRNHGKNIFVRKICSWKTVKTAVTEFTDIRSPIDGTINTDSDTIQIIIAKPESQRPPPSSHA